MKSSPFLAWFVMAGAVRAYALRSLQPCADRERYRLIAADARSRSADLQNFQ
jgi:hypothetical protein